jgi:valyl-tRNA synthetase
MTEPIAMQYQPHEVEPDWYEWWESEGLFKPARSPHKRPFTMVLPPPNVTGALHIGHALTVAIQDTLARWRRMKGDSVLWVPGLDHAGIATQTVVERKLSAERGLTRHDLGRSAFVEEVWAWHDQYGGRIKSQLRLLGATLDWSREVFTMDTMRSEAVVEAFVRLHEQGLIYRGNRMVNWCPHLNTVLSDIELDYLDLEGPEDLQLPGQVAAVEFGRLHAFAYPLSNGPVGSQSDIVVSTTRLETMLGDVAVVVHPDDLRYKSLIGHTVTHPLDGRQLPIIGDAEIVDMGLGSGAVKITPAHDPNDLACAERHNLSIIDIMNDDGTMHVKEANASGLDGIDRFAARATLVNILTEKSLYRGSTPHAMRIAVCSRSGDIIEPRLKLQWFVRCDKMAAAAAQMTESGMDGSYAPAQPLRLQPEWQAGEWQRWLANAEQSDWCISRQLWWGHRIPAYRVCGTNQHMQFDQDVGMVPHTDSDGKRGWVVGRSDEDAARQALDAMDISPSSINSSPIAHLQRLGFHLEQDEDVLDTWFSSGLFPLSALGWPTKRGDKGGEFDASRYPLDVMETGSDILFFWVARMAMLCPTLQPTLGKPFKEIWLHPIVRDKTGKKMSVSPRYLSAIGGPRTVVWRY